MRKYVAIFALTLSALYAEVEVITLTRADGSLLEGYLSRPEIGDDGTVKPYSLLIHIQDAAPFSVYSVHRALQEKALKLGLALLTLEKRGISKDYKDLDDYAHHNFLEERVHDYSQCLDYCRGMIGWDGNIVLLSHSAGGIVAAQLTQELSNVQALLFLSTGGGFSCLEECHYAALKEAVHFEEPEAALAAADAKWEEILSNPVDDQYLADRSYHWWAHMLTVEPLLDTLLRLDIPIYLAHGTEDITLSVWGADRLAEAFQQHGKTNLTYHRLEGYNHDLMQPQVLDSALQWLSKIKVTMQGEGQLLSDWYIKGFDRESSDLYIAATADATFRAEGGADNQGNKQADLTTDITIKSDEGDWEVTLESTGGVRQDRNGNTTMEGSGGITIKKHLGPGNKRKGK